MVYVFGIGIHCLINFKNNFLDNFLKRHRYKKHSDFYRCVTKKDMSISAGYNNSY